VVWAVLANNPASQYTKPVMAQLVFEFVGQELDAVVSAVTRLLGDAPKICEVAPTTLEYKPCSDFDEAISAIRSRRAVSAVFRPHSSHIRYAVINEPKFNGTNTAGWFGCIESTSVDYKSIWDELLGSSLDVVCLGFEEGVELDRMEHLVHTEFPWTAPELVIGAVRGGSGDWDIRNGAAYFNPDSWR
jgi:hypothetical protein